jgi:hypothetical protein
MFCFVRISFFKSIFSIKENKKRKEKWEKKIILQYDKRNNYKIITIKNNKWTDSKNTDLIFGMYLLCFQY